MTISILHSFQSGISDSAVAGLIKPSNWNAGHLLYMDQGRLVGRTTASPAVAHEIEPTGGLAMASGQLYLTDTNVTPGSYAFVSLTVDAKGRITAISNGPGGGSAVLAQEWAENPEDDDITGNPGHYSALHWAAKAEDSATAAAASAAEAATFDPDDFATAAQGLLADSAVQPGDLATVATTGAYSDLSGKPTLGTAAAAATTAFATAAQGGLADSAIQPGDALNDTSAVVGDSDTFWWDGASAARVHKLNRVLVGEASLGGRAAPMSPEPWLEALWDGSIQNSQLAAVNTIGLIGLTGASRASDHADTFGAGSFGSIGGSFWAINDDTTYSSYVWASYHHFNRDDNAIGGGYAAEFGVANFHDDVDVDSYNKYPTGYHGGIVVQSGNDYPTGEDARTPNTVPFAVSIANNGAKFFKGIVFQDDALSTSKGAGGNGVAIEMAALQSVRWLSAAATTAAEMWANSSALKFAAITGATISWGHVSSLNAYTERMFLSSAGVLNITNTGPAYTLYTNTTNTRSASFGVVDQFNAVINWSAASTFLLKRNNVTIVTFFDGMVAGTGTDQGIGTILAANGFYSGIATFLVRTTTALDNGAAAATGTLTNAPSAGNPTKWVPINDNGTTRYIPTWT